MDCKFLRRLECNGIVIINSIQSITVYKFDGYVPYLQIVS